MFKLSMMGFIWPMVGHNITWISLNFGLGLLRCSLGCGDFRLLSWKLFGISGLASVDKCWIVVVQFLYLEVVLLQHDLNIRGEQIPFEYFFTFIRIIRPRIGNKYQTTYIFLCYQNNNLNAFSGVVSYYLPLHHAKYYGEVLKNGENLNFEYIMCANKYIKTLQP